jgi:hypothetical protein
LLIGFANYNNNIILANTPPNLLSYLHTQLSIITPENGIYAWANKYGYWPRNRVESTMSRFKTTFTGTLSSRKVNSQKNEIVLKCNILNMFASLTVPPFDNAA